MSDPVVAKIQSHPKYQELTSKRNSFGVFLTILMLVVYYGYIALIAFDKAFLAKPIGAGVTTLGIPLGMWAQNRMSNTMFYRVTSVLLFFAGLQLLYQGLKHF